MQIKKIDHCATCPSSGAEGRCIGDGPGNAQIVFIGSPPKPDTQDFRTFSDGVSTFFKGLFAQIKSEDVAYKELRSYFIHSSQCLAEKEDAETLKHCSRLVHDQVAKTAAKVIVPLGTAALKSLGISLSVKEARGKMLKAQVGGRTLDCVATYNPGALLRKENVGLIRTFKEDIRKAMDKALDRRKVMLTIPELTSGYRISKTVKEGIEICQEILAYRDVNGKLPILAVDTETTSLDTWRDDFRMLAMSFCWGKNKAAALLLNHREMKDDWADLKPWIQKVLEADNPKVFHNFQYDYKVLELSQGFKLKKVGWDTMCGEYLLDENKKGLYDLKTIVRGRVPEFTDYEKTIKGQLKKTTAKDGWAKAKAENKQLLTKLKEVKAGIKQSDPATKDFLRAHLDQLTQDKARLKLELEHWKTKAKTEKEEAKAATFEDLDVDDLLLYAAIDTDCTWQICQQQRAEVDVEEPDLKYTMRTIMLPGMRVLGRMEHEGIKIDLPYLSQLEIDFQAIMDLEEQEIYKLVGREFNINSTQMLEDILVLERGIKLTQRTKKDTKFQLNEEVLEGLTTKDPLIAHVMTYRKAHKAKNTFLAGIREKSARDGRVHCSFNISGTVTGRLSSSSPNMQNVPSKILGKSIKKLFIADSDDEWFGNLDYSGAEIRVLCAYAKDEKLIETLKAGLNIHSFVASEIFGIPYAEIQARESLRETDLARCEFLDGKRQTAKTTVFLTIYGGGPNKLHGNLVKEEESITLEQCDSIIRTFLGRFPVIEKYMDQIKIQVNQVGYVKTRFGRRRRFPMAKHDWKMRNDAYREGINFPIQSTSSDLVVSQLIEIMDHAHEIGIKPRVTVHDSIGFSFPKSNAHLVRAFLDKYAEDRVLEKFPWMPVPFIYEAAYGPSYGECKTVIKK